MGNDNRNESDGAGRGSALSGPGNGQQGTGGLDSAEAMGAPDPYGAQPQLAGATGASARGGQAGTGETEQPGAQPSTAGRAPESRELMDRPAGPAAGGRDRLEIAAADDRTEVLDPTRGGTADRPADRDLLAQPGSGEDYRQAADQSTPILRERDENDTL